MMEGEEIIIQEKQIGFLWNVLTKDQILEALEFSIQDLFSDRATMKQFVEDLESSFSSLKTRKAPKISQLIFSTPWIVPVILDTMTTFKTFTRKKKSPYESQFRKWMLKYSQISWLAPAWIPYEGPKEPVLKYRTRSNERRQVIRYADLDDPFTNFPWRYQPRMISRGKTLFFVWFIAFPQQLLRKQFKDGMVEPKFLDFDLEDRPDPDWIQGYFIDDKSQLENFF